MANEYAKMMSPTFTESGVSDKFLFAPVEVFTTIAAFNPAQAATPGSDNLITADHVFQANKGFVEMLGAPNKSIIDFNSVGEGGNLKVAPNFSAFLPGSGAVLHEFIKNYKNKPCIILVKDINQSASAPLYYQLGDPDVYCWLNSFEGSTGTSGGGVKGYKLNFSYAGEAVWRYSGAITMKP